MLIEGEARQADGSYKIPHVDGLGRIHLYRYTHSDESYFTALPHEAVHVFRRWIRNTPVWDPFLEEAFASYVSDQVAPVNPGFPLYGHPLTVVAAQWFVRGEGIPLQTLMQRHRQLNLPCKAQSYSLRTSFFHYLHQTYGKASVMRLAYGGKPHSLPLYEEIFGKSFAALESAWKKDLLQRFSQLKNAQQLADSYRSKTPVAYWRICRSGEDF